MSITAMKMALEALEFCPQPIFRPDKHKRDEAITALRQAIAEAERSNLKQVIYLYDEPLQPQEKP